MVLIEHQIDSVKAALESIKHKSPDQAEVVNNLYQEHLANIASDGSFLHLDDHGTVKLFEAKVTDLQHQSVSATPIDDPLLSSSESEGVANPKVVSEAEADGIFGSYQRPDITLYDRLQIATCFWDPERAWGSVAWLAQKYGTSRQTIYQIAYQAQYGLSAGRPGPKYQLPQIETSPSGEAKVPPANVQKDSIRERIILTSVFPGAVTMRPLEQILNEIPGINSCSDTTIWRIINQASQEADRILSEVDYQQVKLPLVFVAVDETYFNGYPIFFIVEPISLAICGYYIPSDKDRSADSWTALLDLVKNEQNLNLIGGLGDAAKAFPKAFKDLLGNEDSFGEDNFHLLYALNSLVKTLERSAYSAMTQVENLITKWCDAKASEDEIESAEQESMKKIDLYDQFAEIATWVRDGKMLIDLSSGEIRDSEINGWLLDFACSEMKKLEHKKVKKMRRRIKNQCASPPLGGQKKATQTS